MSDQQAHELREALIFARGELHRALLEPGSTVGYRKSFERINAALAARPVQVERPDETTSEDVRLDTITAESQAEARAAAARPVSSEENTDAA